MALFRQAGINQTKADNYSLVQPAKQAFLDKMTELYPKTIYKRLAIIEKDAIVTDYVVPKFTGIKKFLLVKLAKKYSRVMK